MSALAHNKTAEIQNKSVTTISANARVDYILRFSKQAVLVVDDNADVYSQVGSQFLTTLSSNQNAAYVSASAKLNNIQIRCRIVEQLFTNSVFDPEQSLAVSVLNLSKNNKQAISIVLEHAQNVSLQIIHELSLLVSLAKKSGVTINVVMLGNFQAGMIIANNKSLFNNTLSILSAKSGQLISPNSRLFKVAKPIFELTFAKKLFLSVATVMLVAIASVITLFQRDVFSFSQLQQSINSNTLNDAKSTIELPLTGVLKVTGENQLSNEAASPNEIFKYLTGQVIIEVVEPVEALPNDIVNAISVFSANQKSPVAVTEQIVKNNLDEINKETINKPLARNKTVVKVPEIKELKKSTLLSIAPSKRIPKTSTNITKVGPVLISPVQSLSERLIMAEQIDPLYYLQAESGFIIQFSGFTQQYVFDEFIADYKTVDFVGYYRWLNKKPILMLTSKTYNSRQAADNALAELPDTLQQRGPWIKSLAAVKKEIKSFQNN